MEQVQEQGQGQGQTVEVQAVDEGPKVRAKKVLTEAQLEALKKGREKLAEKRRQQKEAEVEQPAEEVKDAESDSDESVSPDSSYFCTVM